LILRYIDPEGGVEMMDYDTLDTLGGRIRSALGCLWSSDRFRFYFYILIGVSLFILLGLWLETIDQLKKADENEVFREEGRQEVRVEAVKAGVAKWHVSDDGSTTFGWLERLEE
jgi:hypothetical protein